MRLIPLVCALAAALCLGGCMETLGYNDLPPAPIPSAVPNYQTPARITLDAPAYVPQDDADLDDGFNPRFRPAIVRYDTPEAPGTIVIDPAAHYLYLVESSEVALRYGVGVGREGFGWHGVEHVARKAEWPDWYPPKEMIARELVQNHRKIPDMMPGGPGNPLGARALYLGNTLYRIHETNDPSTIGKNVSSGCIRLRNEDVEDLYDRVKVGAKVVVL